MSLTEAFAFGSSNNLAKITLAMAAVYEATWKTWSEK